MQDIQENLLYLSRIGKLLSELKKLMYGIYTKLQDGAEG